MSAYMIMLRHPLARLLTVALATVLACQSTASAAAPDESSTTYRNLADQADAKRQANAHAEAAELCTRAYRMLPRKQRVGGLGGIVIQKCIQDYENALATPPKGREQVEAHLSLLRAELELLEEFMKEPVAISPEVGAAHDALGPRIRELEQEQAVLQAQLPPVTPDPMPPLDPPPLDPPPLDAPRPDPAPEAEVEPGRPPASQATTKTEPPHDKRETAAILGVGVASLAGGIAMLGGGGWMFSEITRRGNALVRQYDQEVADAAGTDRAPQQVEADEAAQIRQLGAIAKYREDSRRGATGVVVSGAIFAVAGIGLTTWAIVRVRKNAHVVSPQLSRNYIGLGITGRF